LCGSKITEIYDPSTKTFSLGPEMTSARWFFATVSLSEGNVLMSGGNCDGSLNDEIFGPVQNSFSLVEGVHSFRTTHRIIALPNGRVFIAGNLPEADSRTAEIFDPATKSYGPLLQMFGPHSDFAAESLLTGKVLLAGSYARDFVPGGYVQHGETNSELFDPTTSTFEQTGDMLQQRIGYAATRLIDGRVLITGGSADPTSEFYKP